tara:strand:+ start:235 stop:384 length:150 start_codon:yes stop_codon:yes gene_type:complete
MARNDEFLNDRDNKIVATLAQTFQQLEVIAAQLAKLNENFERYIELGDE